MVGISSLSGIAGVQQNQNVKKTDAKLQAAIVSLLTGQRANDAASLAIATQLQSQTAGLRQVSENISQASSAAQVADGAIAQAQSIVGRLQEIAIQANSGTVSAEGRSQLNEEFQGLVKQLDSIAQTTQFNGKNLLDGTLRGDDSLSLNSLLASDDSDDARLEIDSLASQVLFGGSSLNVLSADAASNALSVLGVAANQITSARANVGAFQQTLNYSAATIDSAIVNQEAARSLLNDADFLEASTLSQQAQVQRNASLSLAAQGNRLPAALLKLVS